MRDLAWTVALALAVFGWWLAPWLVAIAAAVTVFAVGVSAVRRWRWLDDRPEPWREVTWQERREL